MELYPYQKDAARTLASALARYGSALDASDTGTGKTFVASALAAAAGKGVAVICPKSVVPVWQEVLSGFGATPLFVLNYEMLRTGRTPWVTKWRQGFKWSPELPKNTLFIWDEVHRCKTKGTANSKMLEAAGQRFLNLMLSATVAESPLDLYTTGLLLGLHNKDDYKEWCLAHGCFRMGFTLMFTTGAKADEGLSKIHKGIFPARGVRVRKSQIPGFPKNQLITQGWDFGDEGQIAAAYAEVEAELAELQIKIDDDFGAIPITIGLRQRQQAELLKVSLLVEKCQEQLEEGKSVVIFVNFNQTIDALIERLEEHNPGVVRGGQSATERKGFIDRFQANETRLILVNVQAGGTGVSLHDTHGTHPRVSLISPSFSPTDMKQVIGRIHRDKGTDVTQWFAYVTGTIEERIVKVVLRKIDQIDTINDGNNLHTTPPGVLYPNTMTNESPTSSVSPAEASSPRDLNPQFSHSSRASNPGSNTPAGAAVDGAANRPEFSFLDEQEQVSDTGRTPVDDAGREAGSGIEAGTEGRKADSEEGEDKWIVGQAGDEGFAARTAGENVGLVSEDTAQRLYDAVIGGACIGQSEVSPVAKWMERDRTATAGVQTAEGFLTFVASPAYPERPAHAKHGPSGLKMKERCAQFLNHDQSNPVAERGTALHKALETGDDSGIVDLQEVEVLRRTRHIQVILERPFLPFDSVYEEVLVDIDLGNGISTYGTCDRLCITGHEAVMFDYKFGYWAVDDAEQNLQTWAYVLGTFQQHQELSKITFHFIQPRLNNVSSAMFTRADIPRLTARIRAVIVGAENPDSPHTPGQGLCEFCAKAGDGSCPALNERALTLVRKYDDSLDIPDLVHGSEITDPATIARLLILAPAVKKAAAGWSLRAREMMDAGIVVPGFTLKSRGGKRAITSSQAAWEMVKDTLTPEEFADCAELSVPDLLKAVGSKAPRGLKKHTMEALEDRLADEGILERGATTMVVSRKHEAPVGALLPVTDGSAGFTSVEE